jgi:hypothetical protein
MHHTPGAEVLCVSFGKRRIPSTRYQGDPMATPAKKMSRKTRLIPHSKPQKTTRTTRRRKRIPQKATFGYVIARTTRTGRMSFYTGVDDAGQTERWALGNLDMASRYGDVEEAMMEAELLRRRISKSDRVAVMEIVLKTVQFYTPETARKRRKRQA